MPLWLQLKPPLTPQKASSTPKFCQFFSCLRPFSSPALHKTRSIIQRVPSRASQKLHKPKQPRRQRQREFIYRFRFRSRVHGLLSYSTTTVDTDPRSKLTQPKSLNPTGLAFHRYLTACTSCEAVAGPVASSPPATIHLRIIIILLEVGPPPYPPA